MKKLILSWIIITIYTSLALAKWTPPDKDEDPVFKSSAPITYMFKSGDTMSGNLNMDGNEIISVSSINCSGYSGIVVDSARDFWAFRYDNGIGADNTGLFFDSISGQVCWLFLGSTVTALDIDNKIYYIGDCDITRVKSLEFSDGTLMDSTSTFCGATAETIKLIQYSTQAIPASTWTNLYFSTIVVEETQGDAFTWVQSSSNTITINEEGMFEISCCIHWQNNTGGDIEGLLVATRCQKNGATMRCTQREWKGTKKDEGQDSFHLTGTFYGEIGDVITFQAYTSNADIEFINATVFDYPVAYELWIKKLDRN